MVLSTEIIVLLITNIISPIITGTVTWAQAKKKYNAEVDGARIDNLKDIIDTQAAQITKLQESVGLYMDRNKQLEIEVVELRKQMFNLMTSICLDFTCKHRQQEEKGTNRYKK